VNEIYWCVLPDDGGWPPKHMGGSRNHISMYTVYANVGLNKIYNYYFVVLIRLTIGTEIFEGNLVSLILHRISWYKSQQGSE